MPVRESEAIVLRSFPLGEGDRLVSFLSRAHGKMRGVAAGARRPKSRFGSTLEPLSYIRIWYYERETRELVRIRQTDLIESFLDLQRDYAAGVTLAVVSEICDSVLGDREPSEQNFRLVLATVRAIKAGTSPSLALAYFTLWTVRLGGWLPRLEYCGKCRAALDSAGYFSPEGTILCVNCRLPGCRPISKASLELAIRMQRSRVEQVATEPLPRGAGAELREHMLDIIERHAERHIPARRLLQELMESSIEK